MHPQIYQILILSLILYSVKSSDVPCGICKAFVSAFKKTVQEKFDLPSFLSKAQLVCGLFVDKAICDGIIPVYGKVVVSNLIIRVLNKENVCYSLGLCFNGEEEEDAYDYANRLLANENMNVSNNINNAIDSNINSNSNNNNKLNIITDIININNHQSNNINDNSTIKLLHLTDIHLDLHYLVNSSAECEKVLCCRSPASPYSRKKGGKFGYPGKCDANIELLRSWAEKAKELKADILVLGGDNGPHDMWDEGQGEVFNATKKIIEVVREYFPNITVYPILGNHEKYPSDLYGENETELLKNYATLYSPFIPPSSIETFKQYGYYTALYRKGLRIVAMNCLLCDTWNMNLIKGNHEAAKKEFIWLEGVLKEAEKNNEKVIILEHIPIDGNFYLTECALRLKALISRYKKTVQCILSGHTHTDDVIPVFSYFEPRPLVSINFVSPSFTTMSYVYPSFRLYELKDFGVEDYIQYRLNVTKANEDGYANWTIAYRATEFFNVSSMRDLENVFKYKVDEKYVIKRYAGSPKGISASKNPKEIEEAQCHLLSDNFADFCECFDYPLIHVETMMSFLDNVNGEWPVKFEG